MKFGVFETSYRRIWQVFIGLLLVTFIPLNSFAQELQKISGTITDTSGEPIIGATVVIKGVTKGTITDVNGHYEITNVPSDATLVFSFIGMTTVELPVAGKSVIDTTLKEEISLLNEVVAVGYGSARKKDLSGSIATVKLDNSPVANIPNTNILESLNGTTAGLGVSQSNTAGGTPSFRIRGQQTLAGSNTPLIVLDGSIYLGQMRDINPSDIASIEVLKDASASAIYGSRAANGVIIITSKEGKSDKPQFKLSASTGVNVWQNHRPNLMSGKKWAERTMDMEGLDDVSDLFSSVAGGDYMYENYENNSTTDWVDLISRAGKFQNYQLSFSGKTDKVNYFISSGYLDQQGCIIGDDYSRLNFRGKIDVKLKNWLTVGFDGSYNISDFSGFQAGVYYGQTTNPYGIAYTEYNKNQLEKYPYGESLSNPLWGVTNSDDVCDDDESFNNFRGSAYVNIDIPFIQGLSYKFSYNRNTRYNFIGKFYYENYYVPEYDKSEDAETNYTNRYSESAVSDYLSSANGSTANQNEHSYVMDNIISYKKTIGTHYFNITLGATRDLYYYREIDVNGSDFDALGTSALGYNGLGNASTVTSSTSISKTTNIGYLARLMYTFNDRYHFTGTLRRDGASVFGENKKWGNFGSVGLAWTMSSEPFIENLGLFDLLKLRVSYGVNGNQSVSAYQTKTSVLTGESGALGYEFSDSSDIIYGTTYDVTLGNQDLGWEQTAAFNFGFDASFLDSRINLTADGYISKTTDLLYEADVPLMTGYTTSYVNLGRIDNWGIELSLNTTNIKKNNFEWDSSLNYSLNRNALKKLYEDGEDIPASGFILGQPLYTIYGYKSDGIVQADDTEYIDTYGAEAGDIKYVDIDKDGDIDSDDRVAQGHIQENFKMNMTNTFRYKNLSLYILITGIFGGNNYYLQSNTGAYVFVQNYPMNNSYNHSWYSEDHPSTKYPRADYEDSRFLGLQSRGFVKIQDLSLSYNMDHLSFIKAMKINSCNIYASVKNLCSFTNWEGISAEGGYGALDSDGNNPIPTIYSVGVNLSF